MLGKALFLMFVVASSLCDAQEIDTYRKYDINGIALCDNNGFYYSRKGHKVGQLSLFNVDFAKKVMLILNNNFQHPQICYEGDCVLIMIVSPQDSVFEIRQPRSYTGMIDSAIQDAIIKTEPLLPSLLNNCDSCFCAPILLHFRD